MNKYICTAKIKYTRQEVQLHINALKISLNDPSMVHYRGRYESLLKDMKRIEKQMSEKENDAMLDRKKGEHVVESSVIQNSEGV